jgi:hypothetical protein
MLPYYKEIRVAGAIKSIIIIELKLADFSSENEPTSSLR